MGNWRKAPGLWTLAGLLLAAMVGAASAASGQKSSHDQARIHELSGRFPEKPTLAPAWSIPVEPFGFAPPGLLYLGERNSLASLDFIGEDRLLFTFRVPALLRRGPNEGESFERQIRAVVLSLPGGALQAETNWTVRDRARYLWMLHDGHFLLRDGDTLSEGDASLKLKPLLKFPGPLLSVGLDPNEQYLVTNSREPEQVTAKPGTVPTPPGASADMDSDDRSSPPSEPQENPLDVVFRIFRRNSSQVMVVSHVRAQVQLPIDSDGYLDVLRGNGVDWDVEMNGFTGGSRILGKVRSACMPEIQLVSEQEALITGCSDMGDDALVAMTTGGQTLWTDLVTDRLVWPLLATSANGLRVAREALYVSHSVNAFSPLDSSQIKGQWVRVIDAASGEVVLDSPANPILDAGGNVALSPSGRRAAILNGNAIQVFDLPAPPPLP